MWENMWYLTLNVFFSTTISSYIYFLKISWLQILKIFWVRFWEEIDSNQEEYMGGKGAYHPGITEGMSQLLSFTENQGYVIEWQRSILAWWLHLKNCV